MLVFCFFSLNLSKAYLLEPTLSCMVQGSSAGAVCYVQVAQMGEEGLCTAGGTVGRRHVQRRLPELVSCICLSSSPQQQAHCPLEWKKNYHGLKDPNKS